MRPLTVSVVVSCTLLVAACASDPNPAGEGHPAGGPNINGTFTEVRVGEFGPSVALTDAGGDAAIWANVSANDDHGISVQGINKGDTVKIESITGLAWFEDQPAHSRIFSAIFAGFGIATAVAPTNTLLSALSGQEIQAAGGLIARNTDSEDHASKQRDGYGRNEKGDFTTKEGGILVCMPSAHGPMYAYDDNYLRGTDPDKGRLKVQTSKNMRGKCHFPNRMPGGKLEWVAKKAGVLHVLAFDSEYRDNAGSYAIRFRIIRAQDGEDSQ